MPYVKKELLKQWNSKLSEAKNLVEFLPLSEDHTNKARNKSLQIIDEIQSELELLAR